MRFYNFTLSFSKILWYFYWFFIRGSFDSKDKKNENKKRNSHLWKFIFSETRRCCCHGDLPRRMRKRFRGNRQSRSPVTVPSVGCQETERTGLEESPGGSSGCCHGVCCYGGWKNQIVAVAAEVSCNLNIYLVFFIVFFFTFKFSFHAEYLHLVF